MMQILVPLDGSVFSEQSLGYATEVARASGGVLHFVRVETPRPAVQIPDVPAYLMYEPADGASARSYLERIARPLRESEQPVKTAVLFGAVSESLAAYVRENSIELVIMTTHGRGGISRAWLGSVADRLVRSTHTPVLLVRPRGGSQERAPEPCASSHVLIPLDGSALSEAMIDPAIACGALLNARYTLLQVVAPPITGIAGISAPSCDTDVDSIREEATAYLERIAEPLRSIGCDVQTRVVIQTQSALGILEQAATEDCTIIAMATHGRTGWSRVALGSVADKVLRSACQPMLMYRPDVQRHAYSCIFDGAIDGKIAGLCTIFS